MAKKVVCVDDSITVHLSLEDAMSDLIRSGLVERVEYTNPVEFLEDVKRGLIYDLAILDINMPQMNGLDLAKELKSIPSVKTKPILALTTENSSDMKKRGKEAGLTGWISKPFSKDKITMALKRVLRL